MTIINGQRIIADDRTEGEIHEQSAEKADAHSFLRASDKADREGQDQQKIRRRVDDRTDSENIALQEKSQQDDPRVG